MELDVGFLIGLSKAVHGQDNQEDGCTSNMNCRVHPIGLGSLRRRNHFFAVHRLVNVLTNEGNHISGTLDASQA